MRRQVVGCVLASLAASLSGCQSWSQVSQGIPNGSRVPPPGTGTYQVPSSYYNNGAAAKTGAVSSTSAPPAGSTAMAAQPLPTTGANTGSTSGAPTTATTANWQIPTVDQVRSGVNSTASAVFDDVNNRANQVVQAGTARAASAVEKYTDPAPSLRPVSSQTAGQAASQPGGQPTAQLTSTPAQAGFAAPASLPTGSGPTNSGPSSAATSRTLSDRSSAQEDPQLDWQAPE